ncbi:MAG: [Fe-S]-binding protein [Candidatus Rokubacteria bacterium]|nr:[Fe-S]-binding protein [Candidatus Rokubacteria bacterium]
MSVPRASSFPRMVRLKQRFPGPMLHDVAGAVQEILSRLPLPIRTGQSVALAVGSRGIVNLDVVARACADVMKRLGAKPFIFPAMGSHGGGTVEGQRSVLEHYGITEATMGCPIRATMDVVQVGETLGLPVWLDRYAAEADWIGVINRVKPHTDFKGEMESGLFKMITIGLGKHRGAIQAHRANIRHGYQTVITNVGREMLRKARIAFGLGIVENGYDETAKVQALLAADMEAGERALLREAKAWMARLPFDPIDLLIADEMGKDISGAGMDSNIIGRHGTFFEPQFPNPKITFIVVCDLTPHTSGNAVGIGNANFTTRRLASKIDWNATHINALTACAPDAAKLPPVLETDRDAIAVALSCLGLDRVDDARVVRVKNTLRLAEVEVSEAFLPEVAKRDDLQQMSDPAPLAFDATGTLLPF